MSYQVKCIELEEKSEYSDCRKIKLIGISAKHNTINKYTPARMYERIKNGKTFFVLFKEKKTYLEKAERDGTKYVRTESNDTNKDNLLKLDFCQNL